MANKNGTAIMLDPRRNQTIERKKLFEEMLLKEMPGTSRTNEPMHAVLEGELGQCEMVEGREAQNVRNHALIHYLATLATSNSTKDTFDFDFVESLLNNGADINSTDKTGQTVFHEVARSWNIDVATFLIKHGANVNQQDQYGRSPLHVAAAVDYAEMVEFLLQNEADIDIKTSEEGQAPIHFAAKNDAINSLQMLLGYGANIDARDSKNRTPLQVSAEMNRSKAAKLLIAEGAPAGVYDNLGNSALSLLIEKIPEVALDAMDQFHSVDTINRKEFYFLNYLEGTKLKKQKTPARTPLEIAVQNERFDIIMHPIMQRLIGVKWQMYGKWGAVFDLALNLVYTILWTVLAVTLPNYGRDLYLPLAKNSWRLVIGILLILFTILEMRKQIVNTMKTRQELKKWREWRAAELERDLAYCHPRWPQEAQYLRAEIKAVRNLSLISGSDWWIYFDWAALVLILATIASHVTFFHYSNDTSEEVHHYIIMPLLLILWLRIFKYARPFESAGPFVVIFGHVLGDIVKWAFLNSIIVIPFTCAFWITFGGISLTPVDGYDRVGPLLYNVFSMMVVNDHGYENLEAANPVMARLLCGSFIAVAAIVTLNLLIALLSNTFERLYENAVANAVMQRARTILLLQKSLRKKQKKKYYDFIKTNGSPEVIVKTLGRLLMMDGDDHATIEHVRDDVKVIVNILGEKFGRKFGKGKKSDLDFVKMDVSKVRRFQEELIIDVKNMKQALQEITEKVEEIKKINNSNTNSNNSSNDDNNNNNNIVTTSSPVVTPSTNLLLENKKKAIKHSLGKTSEKASKKESVTETSDTESTDSESDSESTTKYNRRGKLRKHNKNGDHRKSNDLKDLSVIRKKHKKEYLKGEHKRPHSDSENKDDNNQYTTQHRLAYPPPADSRWPDMNMQNPRFPSRQHSYPPNHYPRNQNDRDLQNQLIPSEKIAYDQVLNDKNQWFATTHNRDSRPHHHQSINNPGFQRRQDFGQRPDYGHIEPNFNQSSPPYYDIRHPEKRYFHTSSFNTPVYPPPVENMTSLLSSSYNRQPLVTNRFQQPPEMLNADKGHASLNYGFQPINEDLNQLISRGYDNRQLVKNTPISFQNRNDQTRRMTRPMTSSVLRDAPITANVAISDHQNNRKQVQQLPHAMMSYPKVDPEFQKHVVPQYPIKQTVQNATLSFPKRPTQQNPPVKGNTIIPTLQGVEIQSVVDKSQGNRFDNTELPQLPAQDKGKLEGADRAADSVGNSFRHEITRETSAVQPEKPAEPHINSEYGEYQASMAYTTQTIPEIDLSQAEKVEPSPFTKSSAANVQDNERNWYNKYRPSTPIAPDIEEKVTFFQEKINENESKKSGSGGETELKKSEETDQMERDMPISHVEKESQSPAVISNVAEIYTEKIPDSDVSTIDPMATKYGVDNKTNVPSNMTEYDPENDSDPPKSSTAKVKDLAYNVQNIVEYETESVSSEKMFLQETADLKHNEALQSQHSFNEPQTVDDNKIPKVTSAQVVTAESDLTGGVQQITVAGMKIDPVPDIGWV